MDRRALGGRASRGPGTACGLGIGRPPGRGRRPGCAPHWAWRSSPDQTPRARRAAPLEVTRRGRGRGPGEPPLLPPPPPPRPRSDVGAARPSPVPPGLSPAGRRRRRHEETVQPHEAAGQPDRGQASAPRRAARGLRGPGAGGHGRGPAGSSAGPAAPGPAAAPSEAGGARGRGRRHAAAWRPALGRRLAPGDRRGGPRLPAPTPQGPHWPAKHRPPGTGPVPCLSHQEIEPARAAACG